MNDDAERICAALDRRFARVAVPACPDGAWHHATAEPVTQLAAARRPRRFAYATAVLVALTIAGLTAQASPAIKQGYATIFGQLFASSKPLQPMIHAADRLTIAEAQRRIPFSIVVPAGLPEGTRFLYAHVLSERPTPQVALSYEAHIASRYYRISISESTMAVGPAVRHLEFRTLGGDTKTWTLPLRRWKHGSVVMDMVVMGLPPEMSDRIVRANTM